MQYNPLPTDRDPLGSRATNLGQDFYTCCGGKYPEIGECFTTSHGQQDWKPAPSLNVSTWSTSIHIFHTQKLYDCQLDR